MEKVKISSLKIKYLPPVAHWMPIMGLILCSGWATDGPPVANIYISK